MGYSVKEGLNKFDLNLLVAFDALMSERGVTRAGRRLGITQAAMSNTLRRLRTAFDDPLFIKTGARMEPTPRAMELSGMIEAALKQVHVALDNDSFDPANSHYVFRVGMVDYTVPLVFPALLDHLEKYAPNCILEVVNTGDFEGEMLESGEVDLVLSRLDQAPRGLKSRVVGEIPFVCIYRPGHPLIKEPMTLEQYLQARHVHYYPPMVKEGLVDLGLKAINQERNVVVRLDSFGMVPTLVAETDLIAAVTHTSAHVIAPAMGLKVQPLPFEAPPLQFVMVWHDRSEESAPHQWFREQVLHMLISLEGMVGKV
ncbi:transcriptional regulator, LysR family [Magnetococcus marinus MC-1]|uniref:Transcriptional regulator, LysR family n=1 Tax=Magnetococcus marinus (strain ATCC BAA-1437 / JCM 17883 / MC-1) TaxID=156889 RepID=A0LD88_MAGMM|nr:transcriptional regulator, LysR family [Magnetococcus marinus MC-1]